MRSQTLENPPTGAACAPTDPAIIRPGDTPRCVLCRWPASAPLAALTSGDSASPSARWSILTAPQESVTGYPPPVDGGAPALGNARCSDHPPFTGGWIGWVGYEAGAIIEPCASHRQSARRRDWPDACFLRCRGAYVHDAVRNQWWTVGDPAALPALDAAPTPDRHGAYEVGDFTSRTGRSRYHRDAARVIELIHAGDAFQVNLAHHLTASFRGDARALFLDLISAAEPWYGAYLERPDGLGAVCSCSPELFLDVDFHDRRVVTRPIKGTRPAGCAEADLSASAKDAAELAMIVDLMRNDLGRVCEFGSVRVADPRSIERHAGDAGVIHGVATVEGRLRPGVGLGELLDATFPPGSVTGAPKIRAMQIIDELEPLPRGPYCGAIGYRSDSGHAAMNVAIRTASILGRRPDPALPGLFEGELSFPVGAGLVADSDPDTEWRETLDKASAFLATLRRSGV